MAQSCGTCVHWKPKHSRAAVGECRYSLPFWLRGPWPQSYDGQSCATYTARQPNPNAISDESVEAAKQLMSMQLRGINVHPEQNPNAIPHDGTGWVEEV